MRETLAAGMPNILHDPIISRDKIIFPPLHIKLGLMKQFVKALNTDGECFQFIVSAFPALSFEKIKAGVFDGPQIRALVHDEDFVTKMSDKRRRHGYLLLKLLRIFLVTKRQTTMRFWLMKCCWHFVTLGAI